VPAGSASNHFRTRDALLDAVVERFSTRERANFEELAARAFPSTPEELARILADAAKEATGPHRTLTLTRYAMLVEAGISPSLRTQMARTGARVNTWAMNWFRIAGSTDPERHAPIIMNYWTGVVLHDVAMPDPNFDPYPQLEALVTTLLRPSTVEVVP
jgi:AcrR family transcriptional regulator